MSLKKLGRYDLIRVLGKGAMGLVYEGRDPNLDRRVAIKTIRVENLSDEASAEYEVRFRTEARSAARLQHPNIVSVYDSDRDVDVAYLVMEFIQGDDLKHHLDQGKLYTFQESMDIMSDLLSALEYAHRQNIVHRDIKPANLLIEANGRVKLTDFGVARIQDSGEATLTQGTMVGTLKYMSPEQVQGRPVDARADLFAAGIILYQLLSGSRPFDGETDFVTIQKIVSHTPAAPTAINPKLPPAMDAVVAKALSKSRDQRYASAQEFAAALKRASQEIKDPTTVPPVSQAARGRNATWTGTVHASEALTGLQSTIGIVSTVTQELELVYWKDIKDSVDAEDIQVFLAKFPTGVYADLARRRLKKLAAPTGDETDIGLRSGTRTLLMRPTATQMEKTVLMGGAGGFGAAAASEITVMAQGALDQAGAPAQFPANPVLAADSPDDVAATGQATELVAATLAPGEPDHDLSGGNTDRSTDRSIDSSSQQNSLPEAEVRGEAAFASASAIPASPAAESAAFPAASRGPKAAIPGRARAPSPGATGAAPSGRLSRHLAWALGGIVALAVATTGFKLLSGPGQPPDEVIIESAVVAPTAPVAPLPGVKPVAAAKATEAPFVFVAEPAVDPAAIKASATIAAAKKAERDKDRQVKQAQAKASAAAADSPVAVAGSVNNPRAACEDRVLLGFQICMAEQCARSVFTQHPLCVERRAIEQRRRDAEQLRH